MQLRSPKKPDETWRESERRLDYKENGKQSSLGPNLGNLPQVEVYRSPDPKTVILITKYMIETYFNRFNLKELDAAWDCEEAMCHIK